MKKTEDQGYYSTSQTAAKLGVTPETVRQWLRTGKLTGIQPGKKLLISSAAIEEIQANYAR